MEWSARERRGFRIAELPGIVRDATGIEIREVWETALGAAYPSG